MEQNPLNKGNDEPELGLDSDAEETLDKLLDDMVGSMKEGYDDKLLPFDAYADQVKHDIKKGAADFKRRLERGYQVLMEEMANGGSTPPSSPGNRDNKKSGGEESGPPQFGGIRI